MRKIFLFFFITINSFSQESFFEEANELICDSLEIIGKKDKLELDRVDSVIKNCTKHFIKDLNSEIIKYRVYNNGDDSVFFDYYLYQISIQCELYKDFYLKELNTDVFNSYFIYDLINSVENNNLQLKYRKKYSQTLIDAKKKLKEIKKETLLSITSTDSHNHIVYINSFFNPLTMEKIYQIELTFKNDNTNVLDNVLVKNKSEIKTELRLREEQLKKYKDLPLPIPPVVGEE